jgi:hypothetical protein
MAKKKADDKLKIIQRIDALLAKAANGGATREEADAALKKVRELVTKYNIKLTDLMGSDATPDEMTRRRAFWQIEDVHIASALIESNNVLEAFARDWRKVMAGEETNAKLLYLAATSRLLNKCIHTAIKGPSSAGKSEIRKRVLAFIPEEDVISFTSLSPRALLCWNDDFPHKILSMGEAAGTDENDFQDYLLRELMSEDIVRGVARGG